jgi:hypothetical protein
MFICFSVHLVERKECKRIVRIQNFQKNRFTLKTGSEKIYKANIKILEMWFLCIGDLLYCRHFGDPCCLHLRALNSHEILKSLYNADVAKTGPIILLPNQAPRHANELGEWMYSSTHY